jgi:hypothetical protein
VSALATPTGRTTYRTLPDYADEMTALAAENPGIVRSIQLPFKTYEGRTVEGLEITADVGASDGKPVFLQLGLSHGRDWPSGELVMEWAHELVNGFKAGDSRVRRLMASARTIVIPVVNPDAFNFSREVAEANDASGGRGGNEFLNVFTFPQEYRRKNCRLSDDSEAANCASSPGLDEPGVDPSRNYAAFWGGPGSSSDHFDAIYRGPGPFSEPESRNVRQIVSTRQVTTLISNHSFGNRILRPPGMRRLGETPDEALYQALGDAMAADNGYLSLRTDEVYSATGTPEEWAYYSTGTFGFAFEIGAGNFHPPYADVVSAYDANRDAYFTALEHTADSSKHSVLEGDAPPGALLRVRKTFRTPSAPQPPGDAPILVDETLETTMRVPTSGAFEWHLNPSTRPLVAQARGRAATGEPSADQAIAGGVAGATAGGSGGADDGANPCQDTDNASSTCHNEHTFTVLAGPGVDNGWVRVRIEWSSAGTDWDLLVFRDVNGDGHAQSNEPLVARSAQRFTRSEEADFVAPALQPGGKYVARVVNFAATGGYDGAATFAGPEPFQAARSESWTLTCESPDGTVRAQQEVTITRGQRQRPDLSACFPAGDGVGNPPAAVDEPPSVLALSIRPRAFRARQGARVTYLLSEPAAVRFRVERALPGRRVGRRCVAPYRSNRGRRRCTRYTTSRGSFAHSGQTGTNSLRFSGRLRGRRLFPGSYRLVAIATDPAGHRSTPRRASFAIVRR